jgi:hypothetical protein
MSFQGGAKESGSWRSACGTKRVALGRLRRVFETVEFPWAMEEELEALRRCPIAGFLEAAVGVEEQCRWLCWWQCGLDLGPSRL